MIKFTTDKNIFVTYGDRSVYKYHRQLSDVFRVRFGSGPFEDQQLVAVALDFCFQWTSAAFEEIIITTNDANFLFFLFMNHESSIKLYKRTLSHENLDDSEKIEEHALALNRRVLKLALETTCDVNYTHQEKPSPSMRRVYVEKLEDLLYLGQELYGFADHLAENRMIEDCNRLYFDERGLIKVARKHHYDAIYYVMEELFQEGFKQGIVNLDIVHELKDKLKDCMNIDYDFAGGVIFEIMEHHSPGDRLQTVESAALVINLIEQGVDEQTAIDFYEGLTISKRNKAKVSEAVYRVNSFDRYMFRPILAITHHGKERLLVGREKWAESIMVMATNGFQWQRAPKEWMKNKCFCKFLSQKHDEHDKYLETEVESILNELGLPSYRHVLYFRDTKGHNIRVDVKDLGEMDFVFIDSMRNKVIVADCKYNRARYEMVGFSTDFKNFSDEYAPKIAKKTKWVAQNLSIVANEFSLRYPGIDFDLKDYEVISLFVINTPTFYVMNGEILTIMISNLMDFINSDYAFPMLKLEINTPDGLAVNQIKHPYFRVQ